MDLPPGRLAGPPQGGADHSRGARRDRRGGDADAGAPARRAVAEDGPLRDRRAVQAPGPARRRPRARDDARGEHHLAHLTRAALLQGPAEAAVPLPDQGARRAAPARRAAAHARVHHEGLLLVRPRRRGPRRFLPAARGGLRPDLRPHGPRVVPGRGRRGNDGRPRRARVDGALRRRRERRRALGRRLRRERRGRERRAAAGGGAAGPRAAARRGRDARRHDDRSGLRAARRARRAP